MKKRKLRQLEKQLTGENDGGEDRDLTVKNLHRLADEDDDLAENDLTEEAKRRFDELHEAMKGEREDLEQ